jgi:hypothetical protein
MITAFRCALDMVSLTTFSTASALAGSAEGAVDPGPATFVGLDDEALFVDVHATDQTQQDKKRASSPCTLAPAAHHRLRPELAVGNREVSRVPLGLSLMTSAATVQATRSHMPAGLGQ